jgi:hypothetical protein
VTHYLRQSFLGNAFIVPPDEPFEPLEKDSAVRNLLDSAERLSGGNPGPFYRWIEISLVRDMLPAAFYGSALISPDADDMDLMSFSAGSGPLRLNKPSFIHILELGASQWDVPSTWGSFFLGGMVFATRPPAFALDMIEEGRAHALGSPFMEGIGECICWAAYKALKSGRPFTLEEWTKVRDISLTLRPSWDDFTNMQTVPYTPRGINSQLRQQMQELDEGQLRILTDAAVRRLRIREEKRREISERFVGGLKRIRGFFG